MQANQDAGGISVPTDESRAGGYDQDSLGQEDGGQRDGAHATSKIRVGA